VNGDARQTVSLRTTRVPLSQKDAFGPGCASRSKNRSFSVVRAVADRVVAGTATSKRGEMPRWSSDRETIARMHSRKP
jgi:hypothetical protein